MRVERSLWSLQKMSNEALGEEIARLARWLDRLSEMTNDPRIRAAIRDAIDGREVED